MPPSEPPPPLQPPPIRRPASVAAASRVAGGAPAGAARGGCRTPPCRLRPAAGRLAGAASPRATSLLLSLLRLLAPVLCDVQQQYLKTITVLDNALVDLDWPSLPGFNDQIDTQTWTNQNQNVRTDSSVTIVFNENIQIGMGYITFQPPILAGLGVSSSVATTISVPSTGVTASGSSLIINSARISMTLQESTIYTVSYDAGVVLNLAVPADTNAAFSVQFHTGDFTAPTLLSVSPAKDEPAVAVDPVGQKLVLTFSEAVAPNAGYSVYVKNKYETQSPIDQIFLSTDTTKVVFSGKTVTITIDAAGAFHILPCSNYQMTYPYMTFTDASPNKNPAAALTAGVYQNFWTSCITFYSPLQNSLDNLISTNIVLTFAEEVTQGTGNIYLTPLGEAPIAFSVTDATRVQFNVPATGQVTIVGDIAPQYLCLSTTMQDCKGKPIDVSIAAGVIHRVYTASPAPSLTLPSSLTQQLAGVPSPYRFTLKPADLTPPKITIVSMYGISESVIRVTVRLDESGTTYCRAYNDDTFTPISLGGTDVPTLTDCAACHLEITTDFLHAGDPAENYVGSSVYDPVRKYAEHEVDITGLNDTTFYWVYCYSHDIEIPNFNVETSAQMRQTERRVRTLDTTPPTFTNFTCAPTALREDSITVTLAMNEVGRAYCKVVNRGHAMPSPNAVIAEAFYADVLDTNTFTIAVNQITTGLGATGMESLFRKTDYDVYCWAQDGEGYPYHGPNGMADVVACPLNYVTTLDLTRPNMRFIAAESISKSQIIITLQVDEGARVWCAAWDVDPLITNLNFETKIKGNQANCMDNKGRQCGTFWIYDLDDLEDSALDGVVTQANYDSSTAWKYNQDVDIIVYNLIEEKMYPYIYCFAEDDEKDGIGSAPNRMMYDAVANAGPSNVYTIHTAILPVETLDESPPSFTQLSMQDPTAYNDRIIVTFKLNEAGTAYCRVTLSDSGETTLRINRILSANYQGVVTLPGQIQYITIDKLESRDTQVLYEARQYDVYCWAMDSAVDTQGQPRPNYMIQDYVEAFVGTTGANALSSPTGGHTRKVWVRDLTPPNIIYVSSEALTEDVIQITLQLNEPGTVWCQPVMPTASGTYVDTADITVGNYKSKIIGTAGAVFMGFVPQAYRNVDVEVSLIINDAGTNSFPLIKETPYNIYCFAMDDWKIQAESGSHSVNFNYLADNVGSPNEVTLVAVTNFKNTLGLIKTLDLTPPSISITGVSADETTITVTLRLDETGTAWCQAVRKGFSVPTILEILDTNFFNTYDATVPTSVTTVTLLGYDRPKNFDNTYLTPLVLGTDYDIYCYAEDDLCTGCKVTNGVSFTHVSNAHTFVRTTDTTKPRMRYVAAESIARDQIIITLQVDEGAKVWCAAWITDPLLTSLNYETKIKNFATQCKDNKGRQCGTFWVYDLDDLEDSPLDGVSTQADYDAWVNWKYNRDVDIILFGLVEEQDYPFIYCYAEDDEPDDGLGSGGLGVAPNKMLYSTLLADTGPQNVHTMQTEIGTVQTLDESPPSFTLLQIMDPTAFNDRIIVTFQLNEAGTAYCRVTRTDSGETTLRINQVLSANYWAEVTNPTQTGYITVDKLETRDNLPLYEAAQYDVYCWAKDSAVDTHNAARPNYMTQDYVEQRMLSAVGGPVGGKTPYIWVKDMTPPTVIVVSREALTESVIQITLQLNEPGTVWCHPAVPTLDTHMDIGDVVAGTYVAYIKGRSASFRQYVPTPYMNVDVEVNKVDLDTGAAADFLLKEKAYNIYCFAEDDWKIQATNSVYHSVWYSAANVATPSMTVGNGNDITFAQAVSIRDQIGQVTTLDLTPPSITIISLSATETVITVTLRLDETGTAWCQAVRHNFNVPTVLEILDTNFYSLFDVTNPLGYTTVQLLGYDRPKNAYPSYVTPLVLGTDYDVYCYADDNLCVGCKVTNGVSATVIASTKKFIRTPDTTRPNMRYIHAESIAKDQIIVTLQVDEGSMVWCAAWATAPVPAFSSTATAIAAIKAKASTCKDGKGRQCGTFWIYDLDDIEDSVTDPLAVDGVANRADYDKWQNWKYNQDVDIIIYGLTEKLDYSYIYCYAEDDEVVPNTMIYDTTALAAGPNNMYTIQTTIGTVRTLDESPPSFTLLALKDPTAFNDRLIVTFQLNEAGTTYCRATRSDSGETTLRINQILTADYSAVVADSTVTGYITVDKLESRDTRVLYEASQYDVYCWAKDSATDTQGLARPNYMIQDYIQTAVGAVTTAPLGGQTKNVWIVDATPPVIVVVSREALAEDVIQVTLQLNEPGTIWCQISDQDASATATFCRYSDVKDTPTTDPCYFEKWIKGVYRAGTGNTQFRADVHIPYQDYDIDMNMIENKISPAGVKLTAQYKYTTWCFAEDDWKIEAVAATLHGPNAPTFLAPTGPNKVTWTAVKAVRDTIGDVVTLDQTPPTWTAISYTQYSETQLLMTMTLDETGTIWCMPVRQNFAEPSINEILQNNEYNTACGSTGSCTVTMQNLQPKTQYDIWCYTEDDNVYPQRPNGRKFTSAQKVTASTLDTTPPILTIVSAESPISTDIRIKVRMEEPGTVWCNSFVHGTAYGTINFDSIAAGNYYSYVGLGLTPGGPINQNVEVQVKDRVAETAYDTYCTAQDKSTLPSVNTVTTPVAFATAASVGVITTLDQSPPTFTVLGGKGIDEHTVQVTFKCNEPCRAYCRLTRSDSGETSLSINRILKANFQADQTGSAGATQTIQLDRLENDLSLPMLERGTLYDTYCWIKDQAVQNSCHAEGAGATCTTYPKPNYQSQVYVNQAFGGTPPATVSPPAVPAGGTMMHVRTPDTTPPNVIFIEAESTEETSITVTLQLDEPGTAYCKAFTTVQTADAALYTTITTGTQFKNTVTNWNNIYRNFEVRVANLIVETRYYVYCVAEDDELMEGQYTIIPAPTSNNKALPMLTESTGRFTLDLTPPQITVVNIASTSETTATVTVHLDEPGTVWCKAVRDRFDPPTINQIIAANFLSLTILANTDFTVLVENLIRDTEYDVYCHARDRGTEVDPGCPLAGNPGNDVSFDTVLTTKRDIHTMGDSTPPVITLLSPVLAQSGVAVSPVVTFTFNEDIQAGTGNIVFTPEGGGGSVSLAIIQANTDICVSSRAKLNIILNTLKVDFSSCASSFLTASTKWYVSFAAGVLKDASYAQNAATAFGLANSYYFTTGTT